MEWFGIRYGIDYIEFNFNKCFFFGLRKLLVEGNFFVRVCRYYFNFCIGIGRD